MKRPLLLASALSGIVLLTACWSPNTPISTPPPADHECAAGIQDAALVAELEELVSVSKAAGAVVGIASPTLGYQVHAFGWADPDEGAALETTAIFDIGSIQKNFDWMLAHRIAQTGALDIDDPIAPEGLDLAGATWRDLMSHSSGIRHWDQTGFIEVIFGEMGREYGWDEMVGYLTADGGPFLAEPTGAEPFHYSNYGPLIAVHTAAALGGYGDARAAIRAEIFEPLGLEQTSFQGFDAYPALLTDGFWEDGRPHAWTDDYADTLGFSSAAGGLIFTDACDLLTYAQGVFEDETFLSQATIDDALDASRSVDWLFVDGDQAVDIGDLRGGFVSYYNLPEGTWGHYGSGQHGHSSAYMHRVSDGTTFVALANVAADDIQRFTDPTTGQTRNWKGDNFAIQGDLINAMAESVP